jgi:O-antigen ligase
MTSIDAPRRIPVDRGGIALALAIFGTVVSLLSPIILGSATLVPASLGVAVALAIVPFPAADRLLAIALIGTTPLILNDSLPNLPLAAAVLAIGLVRVAGDQKRFLGRRTAIALVLMWIPLALGVAISYWPPASVWVRPLAILGLGVIASLLGALVWREPARLSRWLEGITAGLVVVAVSAAATFALQFVAHPSSLVEGMAGVQGLLRGTAAADKFAAQNNWLIVGSEVTLRALSPLFPSPNNLGAYIGVAGPLAVAVYFGTRSALWGAVALAGIGTAASVTVLTYSRSTWLAAAAAGVVIGGTVITGKVFRTGTHFRRKRLILIGVVIGAIALGGVLTLLVGTSDTLSRVTTPLGDRSVTDRLATGEQAWSAIGTNLLRGAGLGNWRATLDGYASVTYIHNVYLEYAAAAGVLGGAWAVAIVLIPLASGLSIRLRKPRSDNAALLATALIAIGVFAGLHFLFDDNLLNPQYAWLYLFAAGGALGLAEAPPRHWDADWCARPEARG